MRNEIVVTKYVKTFTSGYLKGLSLNESLSHANIEVAQDWMHGILDNAKRGVLEYTISDLTTVTHRDDR